MSDTYEKIPEGRGFVYEHDNQLYRRFKQKKTTLWTSSSTCNTAMVQPDLTASSSVSGPAFFYPGNLVPHFPVVSISL